MKKLHFAFIIPSILLMTGCYLSVSKEALKEIANSNKPSCPFKAGNYDIKSGDYSNGIQYGTVQIVHQKADGAILCKSENATAVDPANVPSITAFFNNRNVHDIKTNGFFVSYSTNAQENPNIYFIRKVKNTYEVYTNCSNREVNCGYMNNLKEVKDHTKFLKSTSQERIDFINQERKRVNDAAYSAAIEVSTQTPNYLLIPK